MPAAPDRAARWLEAGLAVLLAVAPLPFGSVHAGGRLTFECGAWGLLALWTARGLFRPTPLPSRWATAGLLALSLFAWVQALPLGAIADAIVPATAAARRALAPPPDVVEAERRLLGVDPAGFDRPGSLSVDAPASASAARTATAYAAIALVAFTVVSLRGPRGLALGLLAGGAFQALYGILVLASGYDRIWGVPKTAYLESATGTFINRNHYAAYLALALASGAGLLLSRLAGDPRRNAGRPGLARWSEGPAARTILVAVAVALVAAGLLVSFSRAGITVGLLALSATLLASDVPRRRGARLALLASTLTIAAVPLLSLGAGPLAARFASAERDFFGSGGRATVWSDTVRLAAAHPVIGSGLGTFAEAYPPFRSPEVRAHYTHAHNDWLQAVAEGGLVGSLLLLAIVAPVARRWPEAVVGRGGPLVAGFASGLAAFAAHAILDFPARIPAVTAAALASGAVVLCARPRSVADDSPPLRLVATGSAVRTRGARVVVALALPLAVIAVTSGALGADEARTSESPWDTSGEAARAALGAGPGDPSVRGALVALRERIGARPFLAEARAAYAAVLLEAAFGTPDAAAAAFHAQAAAEWSPVSRPVVALAADVLLRAGRADDAVEWVRAMFGWDPREAARMLERMETLLPPDRVARVLPDDPRAWEAWAVRLARSGRREGALALRTAALARWPGDPSVRVAAADALLREGEIEEFRRVVPPDLVVMESRENVALLAHRARSRGLAGDRDGAIEDARAAVRVGENEPGAFLRAGDALAAVGESEAARGMWVRALHGYRSARSRDATVAVLSRIARLDEREGRAGDAFRAWREVRDLDPGHREAAARLERLSGSAP